MVGSQFIGSVASNCTKYNAPVILDLIFFINYLIKNINLIMPEARRWTSSPSGRPRRRRRRSRNTSRYGGVTVAWGTVDYGRQWTRGMSDTVGTVGQRSGEI